ncbi:hypothetical protein XA68_14568 [Ophiocordyceps unilateralis]|uniref:L-gulonate 3-dehydrogenase n=1 Tax=Ophiocordyceps unilateralis TaxID=268505 RepID=A0A2A9PA97_OPHUN|nr:hypothetical protein XA68_14568 [Ophiocordyceps unilateralis]
MAIKTVGVIGTGVIGSSWTGLFLAHGLRVLVSDPAPDAEKKLAEYLDGIWPTMQAIGLTPGASLSNYTFVGPSMDAHYAEVDFIQENAPEKPELKAKVIGEIDAGTRPDVVIASSSSGIPSSRFISQCTKKPGRVLIGHPFNPPHMMPLVEVVPHPKTDETSIEKAMTFYRSIGRKPIHIRKEVPGFAANRLQAALCQEAYSLVRRGILSAQDLDDCMTNSLGPRWAVMGPLMANAMGGGGGAEGFKHLLEHIGPGAQVWLKDMQEHDFQWDEAGINAVSVSVAEELKGKSVEALERQRDKQLVELLGITNPKATDG